MSILRIQLNSFGSEKFENSNCSPAEHKGTFEYLPPNFKLSFRFESIVRHYGKLNDPALLRTVAQNYMEEVIAFFVIDLLVIRTFSDYGLRISHDQPSTNRFLFPA